MPRPVHYFTVPDGEIIGYAWAGVIDVGRIHRAASSSSAYKAGLNSGHPDVELGASRPPFGSGAVGLMAEDNERPAPGSGLTRRPARTR